MDLILRRVNMCKGAHGSLNEPDLSADTLINGEHRPSPNQPLLFLLLFSLLPFLSRFVLSDPFFFPFLILSRSASPPSISTSILLSHSLFLSFIKIVAGSRYFFVALVDTRAGNHYLRAPTTMVSKMAVVLNGSCIWSGWMGKCG